MPYEPMLGICKAGLNQSKMEKIQYENMKKLNAKVQSGQATFKERNVFNIIQKRKKKCQPIYCNGGRD